MYRRACFFFVSFAFFPGKEKEDRMENKNYKEEHEKDEERSGNELRSSSFHTAFDELDGSISPGGRRHTFTLHLLYNDCLL